MGSGGSQSDSRIGGFSRLYTFLYTSQPTLRASLQDCSEAGISRFTLPVPFWILTLSTPTVPRILSINIPSPPRPPSPAILLRPATGSAVTAFAAPSHLGGSSPTLWCVAKEPHPKGLHAKLHSLHGLPGRHHGAFAPHRRPSPIEACAMARGDAPGPCGKWPQTRSSLPNAVRSRHGPAAASHCDLFSAAPEPVPVHTTPDSMATSPR